MAKLGQQAGNCKSLQIVISFCDNLFFFQFHQLLLGTMQIIIQDTTNLNCVLDRIKC